MNIVIMMGRLTADPKTGTTQSGIACARFSIAVDRRVPDANGNRQTDFFNCVAWRGTAEFIGKYFAKGMRIAISGELQNHDYTAQDGSSRRGTEIIVASAEFCERKQAPEAPAAQAQQDEYQETDDDDLPF